MKRTFVVLAFVLLTVPSTISAATVQDLQTQVMYVLGQMAQLQARAAGTQLACMLIATKSAIHAGEQFDLI
jgi:hypothetical protein